MKKGKWLLAFAGMTVMAIGSADYITEAGDAEIRSASMHLEKNLGLSTREWPGSVGRFTFDSGYEFNYPDAVRGIFVTGHTAGGSRFDEKLELVNDTALNSMVIDVKEDDGYVTFIPDEDEPFYEIARNWISDPEDMMAELEENEVYPIARIVAFKDTELAEKRPDLSFQENGEVWKNSRGEAFTNPFLKEVWDYNVDVAKKAAEMGFEDIQFDYVRFPEGFENMDEDLEYSTGDYEDSPGDNIRRRVDAVTDFVEYAREELQEYDVDISVDVFGYAITTEETPGIGQNFARLAEAAEVMSSMIYPSHWTDHFGVEKPDLHPYEITDEYAQRENELLNSLDDQPVSRPWIQDFTASYLGEGNYQNYGVDEVEAQIQALYDNDIHEFLLWNASNNYTEGVDYMLDLDEDDLQ